MRPRLVLEIGERSPGKLHSKQHKEEWDWGIVVKGKKREEKCLHSEETTYVKIELGMKKELKEGEFSLSIVSQGKFGTGVLLKW